MTSSPSEATLSLDDLAASVATATGGELTMTFGTAKVKVSPDDWVGALTAARDDFGLVFFSWLSAVDWANEVQVGDPLDGAGRGAIRIDRRGRRPDRRQHRSLHDRPAQGRVPGSPAWSGSMPEPTGTSGKPTRCSASTSSAIPNLIKLYLPDGFEGYPLQKSFPLLTREVKPWPGTVDVEGMPGQGR